MDLYDDLDTKQKSTQIEGWSSGIKMLQTQLAAKKAQISNTPPSNSHHSRKHNPFLTPLATMKRRRSEDSFNVSKPLIKNTSILHHQPLQPIKADKEELGFDWGIVDEYDPLWPNEYEKLLREKKEKNKEIRREERERERKRGRDSHRQESPPPTKYSGMCQRVSEEDSYTKSPPRQRESRGSGAAIAPPPSLQEAPTPDLSNLASNLSQVSIPYGTNSVAAKIMAKFGYKDGQGLGKKEQGMSIALQVEKTSKRGGKIIHEKDLFIPPAPVDLMPPPMAPPSAEQTAMADACEPTITEIMKTPSKVVLLRNMVGPGDVDNELEPEVKDECNTKYGDVISVVIYELPNVVPEEAVRIYVEFKRIESAIKAVVDLNGRFFGGRQVRAGFFNFDKYKARKLND